jgi:hypothetical protein
MLAARKRFPSPSSARPVPSSVSCAGDKIAVGCQSGAVRCTPRGSQTVRREQGRGGFSGRLRQFRGAASILFSFVFIYWCVLHVLARTHVLARAQIFTQLALSIGFSHPQLALSIGFSHHWLCQRFTNASTRLLATHLESFPPFQEHHLGWPCLYVTLSTCRPIRCWRMSLLDVLD